MSLYENMNARKKKGISRSKKNSTISDKAYKNMKAGFPKKKSLLKEEWLTLSTSRMVKSSRAL